MSGRIVGEVLDYAPIDLRPAEFLVLIAVGEDARDTDRVSKFSDVENLTRRTRLKAGTVRNALAELVGRGLIIPTYQRARIGLHQEYTVARLTNARHATIRPIHTNESVTPR